MIARAPAGRPYVYVTRGNGVESVHAVAACAAEDSGEALLQMGDVHVPVFLRSAWKPFIAAEVVASGAARRFEFDAREIAVMAASHNGEPFHVEAVGAILRKIGLDAGALQCGAHAPAFEPAALALVEAGSRPTALHNNCSGKHAGLLAMCVHLGFEPAGYLALEHPVQRRVLAFCASVAGDDLASMPLGVDGCGIPVLATSLAGAALAFARLGALRGLDAVHADALGEVRAAMVAEPAYVAGTGRFDTALMQTTRGRLVCKAGAEGLHATACESARAGRGLVLKVVDGNRRAAPPAAIGLLREVGWLSDAEYEALAPFATVDVRSVGGRVVGEIGPEKRDTFVASTAS